MSAGFCPDHKAAMVLFLDRVYGIEDQDFLLHLLEVGFLPDLRAAASLDTVRFWVFYKFCSSILVNTETFFTPQNYYYFFRCVLPSADWVACGWLVLRIFENQWKGILQNNALIPKVSPLIPISIENQCLFPWEFLTFYCRSAASKARNWKSLPRNTEFRSRNLLGHVLCF